MEDVKEIIKSLIKKLNKTTLIVVLIVALIAGATYVIIHWVSSTVNKSINPYRNSVSVSENGEVSTSKTAKELWDDMIAKGYEVNKYLDNPEELAKLLKAELITQLPDTRENVEEEIDWEALKDGDDIQGIIKFKRHDGNGNTSYLTYATPSVFQEQIEIYQKSTDETTRENAKQFALTHFTLKQKPKNLSSRIQGTGSFTKYNLSNTQLKEIANLCNQEQGDPEGCAAEASLIANKFEIQGGEFNSKTGGDGLYEYVKNVGWWAHTPGQLGKPPYNVMEVGESTEEEVQAVRAVLESGYRTLPKHINEHDCLSDLINAPSRREDFISGVTVLENTYSSTYTFYCFPTDHSDPFGYTDPALREKYSDFCYEFGTWEPQNGTEDYSATDPRPFSSSGGDIITDVSNRLLQSAESTPWSGVQLCLNWVDNVYDNAGVTPDRKYSASEAANAHIISKDRNKIPVGAAVYGNGSSSLGHVGMYIGNGKVKDNTDKGLRIIELDRWIQEQGFKGWGWEDGNQTRGLNGSSTTSSSSSNSSNGGENYTGELDTSQSGDGYPGTYTSSAGFTYKDFKQGKGSYATQRYWDGTIRYSGCGPTSIAILASGLKPELNYNPGDTAKIVTDKYGNISSDNAMLGLMNDLGMPGEIVQAPTAEDLQNYLKEGKVMMLLVKKSAGSIFPGGEGHFIAAVDVDSNGRIYVMNPNGKKSAKTGWYDASVVAKGCQYIFITDAGKAPETTIVESDERATPGYEAVVATWKEIEKVTDAAGANVADAAEAFGVTVETGTTYTITTKEIDYEDMVQSYVMPFDLLWNLLVIGQSKGFIMELVDLVYGSEIEVSIYDNLTTTTNKDTWSYNEVTEARVLGSLYYGKIRRSAVHEHLKDDDPLETESGTIDKTVVTKDNTLEVALTKAHTWIANYDLEYTYDSNSGTNNTNQIGHDDQALTEWEYDEISRDIDCEYIDEKKQEIADEYNEYAISNSTKDNPIEAISKEQVDDSHLKLQTRKWRTGITNTTGDIIITQKYVAQPPRLTIKAKDIKRNTKTEETNNDDSETEEENDSENEVKSLDNFLFIGDSRYVPEGLTGIEIAKAGKNIRNCRSKCSKSR